MYGSTTLEVIEEYVRLGAPRAWLDDPAARERLASQHLRMPAFEDVLSASEIGDVVAFASALEGVGRPGGEDVDAGRAVARRLGCLSCHGVEGSGGRPNPGSLGGFVPGFLGRNFTDLVGSEAEFREWVLEGRLARLERNPLVRYFWRRQQIKMPAFRGELEAEELDQLWAWVQALRAPS
jgi:mono/diheme cytochrome c family protein